MGVVGARGFWGASSVLASPAWEALVHHLLGYFLHIERPVDLHLALVEVFEYCGGVVRLYDDVQLSHFTNVACLPFALHSHSEIEMK